MGTIVNIADYRTAAIAREDGWQFPTPTTSEDERLDLATRRVDAMRGDLEVALADEALPLPTLDAMLARYREIATALHEATEDTSPEIVAEGLCAIGWLEGAIREVHGKAGDRAWYAVARQIVGVA